MKFIEMSDRSLPPIVQNCPNRFSDATRNPLLSVVTCVSLSWDRTVANCTGGKSFNGLFKGGCGVTICCDGTFTVDPMPLARPLSNVVVDLVRICFNTLKTAKETDNKYEDLHKSHLPKDPPHFVQYSLLLP